jgi:PAS domain S-box-containing protein
MPNSKLLIVEDEAIVAEDLSHKVRVLGYEVIGIASSAEEATARVRESSADIVLLDIHLEGHLDGVDIARALKQACDPAIVFVTAHSDLQTVKKAEAISPVGFILKPFGERDLAVQLEIALHKHRSNKALLKNEEQLRRANAQLLKTQDVLLAAQRGARAGIWEIDLRTGGITWSEPYYELFGIDRALPPSPDLWISFIHPDDRARITAEHERSIKQNHYESMEFRIVKPDGSIRWVHRTGEIEFDESGKAIRINGISFDITARKQAEQAVAAVALFPAQNPSPVLRVDGNGILLYKNPASDELLNELNLEVGRPVPSYLRDLVDHSLRTTRQEKSEQTNGCRHYLISVTPIVKEHYANLYWTDITERKVTEQALREREAQLALELTDATHLQEISAALLAEEDAEALYEKLLDVAVAIMRSDFASMQMFDPERGKLRLLAFRGFNAEAAMHWEWVQSDSSTSCGSAFRDAGRIIVTDVERCEFIVGSEEDLRMFRSTGIRAMQSTPLISRSGRLVGMISTHWNRPHRPDARELRNFDILARQAADILEHRQAERSIRESEQRFRAFTSATNDVVYLMSADWTEMRHLQGREFITDTLEPSRTWLDKYIHPDDQPRVMQTIQRAIQTKSVFELEHRVIRVDGSLAWVCSRAIPILDQAGEIIEWFGAASDVTHRKQSEAWLADQGEEPVGR